MSALKARVVTVRAFAARALAPRAVAARAFVVCSLVACSPKADPFAVVRNQCRHDDDCRVAADGQDGQATCNLAQRRCEHASTSVPYPLVLQVTLQEDGGTLVPRYTREAALLTDSVHDGRIEVPDAVTVMGAIRGSQGGNLVAAAVTFSPVADATGYPVAAETLYTGEVDDDHADNLRAVINPSTPYDILIQPLRADSETLPPKVLRGLSFDGSGAQRLDVDYPALTEVAVRLLDVQGMPIVGAYVRLVDKATRAVISSTNRSGGDGRVTLAADATQLAAGFEVMLGVANGSPWLVQVRADPARLVPSGDDGTPTLTVPTLPTQVTYEGRLAMPDSLGGQFVDPSELIFVSTFPVPVDGSANVDRDWCRPLRSDDPLPSFGCSAEVSVTTAMDGQFSVPLLPGEYSVFARPSGASKAGQEVRTVLLEGVLVQSPGAAAPQSGQLIELAQAIAYDGRVVTPDRRLSPNVTVRAEALDVRTPALDLGPVAHYARSIEALTDSDGAFKVGVDVGYYDLSLRPSPETGFAWSYITNRKVTVDDLPGAHLQDLVLQSPVVYAGTLVAPDGSAIGKAAVDAYAIISSLDDTTRAVRVGSTTAAEDGSFELLLPPQVEQSPAATDGGVEAP